MTAQIGVSVEGRLGVIALDRPEAINALSLDMIEAIASRLLSWREDEAIRAVLFEGRGPKGFCAGGDVREVREHVIAGHPARARAYFAAEYRMDGLIATYPKPVIAMTDGVVMGGGIGIAGHASFRITTPRARYAMPETAIGFVPDVGVNWILGKAPEHRALMFLMSGLPVTGADVLALGLADCAAPPEAFTALRAGIVAAVGTGDIEPALVALLQSASIQAGERELCDLADRHADAFEAETAGEIVAELSARVGEDAALAPVADAMASRSPTSLEASLLGHRAARRLASVDDVLALDLRLASTFAVLPDFAEGVRAQLIDRDRAPRWQPGRFAEVDLAPLLAAVSGPQLQRVSTS